MWICIYETPSLERATLVLCVLLVICLLMSCRGVGRVQVYSLNNWTVVAIWTQLWFAALTFENYGIFHSFMQTQKLKLKTFPSLIAPLWVYFDVLSRRVIVPVNVIKFCVPSIEWWGTVTNSWFEVAVLKMNNILLTWYSESCSWLCRQSENIMGVAVIGLCWNSSDWTSKILFILADWNYGIDSFGRTENIHWIFLYWTALCSLKLSSTVVFREGMHWSFLFY